MKAALLRKLEGLEQTALPLDGPRLIALRLMDHPDDMVSGAQLKPGSPHAFTVDRADGESLEGFFHRLEGMAAPGETLVAMLHYADGAHM